MTAEHVCETSYVEVLSNLQFQRRCLVCGHPMGAPYGEPRDTTPLRVEPWRRSDWLETVTDCDVQAEAVDRAEPREPSVTQWRSHRVHNPLPPRQRRPKGRRAQVKS